MTSSCCATGSTAPTTTTPARDPTSRYAELVAGPLKARNQAATVPAVPAQAATERPMGEATANACCRTP